MRLLFLWRGDVMTVDFLGIYGIFFKVIVTSG